MSAQIAIAAVVSACNGIAPDGIVAVGDRPAVLAALVVTQALASGQSISLDARLVGMAAAAIALWRRAPILVVIVVAAAATALTRLFG